MIPVSGLYIEVDFEQGDRFYVVRNAYGDKVFESFQYDACMDFIDAA